MTTELPKQYDPHEAQRRWLTFWDEHRYWHSEPDPSREPFSIVIPPPNVTGALHMGHALNNTLQDVLVRWRRMQGYNTLWMPGTDHAGIATQAVVERRIQAEEGKSRRDLGREELVRRIWEWKDQYEKRILGQLRSLGCSCDWDRTRFTLDEGCSRAVRVTFFKMFKDGLIYRGKRLVNWDTHLQTSVADDETYTEEIKGTFWTFRYPVVGTEEFIRFSTTRPETMLGDTAVAVHPGDPRYRDLIGKRVRLPLVNREIPIIADGQLVDPELGTGCVKVTPAHDPNDYQCGLRHGLPMINILNPDGTINANGGPYAGLDRYAARERVTADMERLHCFEGKEDRLIPMRFSDRSKTPIEPYLSDQWFVRMETLGQTAIDAVRDGRVKFHPERYANTYLEWLGEKRDWCISRQLWWGHRIPVWGVSCQDLHALDRVEHALNTHPALTVARKQGRLAYHIVPDEELQAARLKGGAVYERARDERPYAAVYVCLLDDDQPTAIQELESFGCVHDPDVLDTWFSSALWPHSTFGWPEPTPELYYYYPTSVLVTSRDIITLWVARMVLTGLYNVGDVPFHHVYITPKLLDGFGETMNKSKGNGVDPLDIIERYGTDALRYQMVFLSGDTQDSRMPVSNVCPHCDTLVPVKHEHMGMRTRKITCPNCKKAFRPGGPWHADDPELPTARQASPIFEMGRNFANKLWNAARFLMLNLEGYTPAAVSLTELPVEDRWILSRLAATTVAITEHLGNYAFSDVARTLYEFTWSEFCDWYVEMSKGRLKDPAARPLAQRVGLAVLDAILRLASPVMPFVTESIWQALAEAAPARGLPNPTAAAESVMVAPWPAFPAEWPDAGTERSIARMQGLVRGIREVRNRYMVNDQTRLDVAVRSGREAAAELQALAPFISQLAGVGKLEVSADAAKPKQSATVVQPDCEAYVSLAGLIDLAKERAKLEKELAGKRKQLEGTQAKLNNAGFRAKAPPEVIRQQEDQVAELGKQIQAIEASLGELS
jgi:valyl-tRNA synthetase